MKPNKFQQAFAGKKIMAFIFPCTWKFWLHAFSCTWKFINDDKFICVVKWWLKKEGRFVLEYKEIMQNIKKNAIKSVIYAWNKNIFVVQRLSLPDVSFTSEGVTELYTIKDYFWKTLNALVINI